MTANRRCGTKMRKMREDAGQKMRKMRDMDVPRLRPMNMSNISFDEKTITAFLETAIQRPPYILTHLGKEAKRLGIAPMVLQVTFKDPPARDGSGNLIPQLPPPTP
jgi:hypothetical protein